jgi:CheY-like chemotaxis protein
MPHTVQIVDDHEPLRRRIRSVLEREGFDICGEAANGQEAIRKVKEQITRSGYSQHFDAYHEWPPSAAGDNPVLSEHKDCGLHSR